MDKNENLILLVDDDEDDRELFEFAMNQINLYTYFSMPDGTYLIDYLSKSDNKVPSLVFLDINMPKMSGFETLEMVRQRFDQQSLPVAIYSTSAEPVDVETASKLGANFYLKKPMDVKSLINLIKNTITRNWNELKDSKYFCPFPT